MIGAWGEGVGEGRGWLWVGMVLLLSYAPAQPHHVCLGPLGLAPAKELVQIGADSLKTMCGRVGENFVYLPLSHTMASGQDAAEAASAPLHPAGWPRIG